MSCACNTSTPLSLTFPTGTPAGSSDRICLLSGDGPPSAPPASIIHIWYYRDNLTGIIYPWNPQTAQWLIDGNGYGGAGITTRTCCNFIIGHDVPVAAPLTPLETWQLLDATTGNSYRWNPETAAWITFFGGTGGAGSGGNNGMYWGNGAPVTPPANIYVDNLYGDIDNDVVYWWVVSNQAWE